MKHIFSYHFKQKQQSFSISCCCVLGLSPAKTAAENSLINMRNPWLEVFISGIHLWYPLQGHVDGLASYHLRLKSGLSALPMQCNR